MPPMTYEQLRPLIMALLQRLVPTQAANTLHRYDALAAEPEFQGYQIQELRHAALLCNALGFLRDFTASDEGFCANGVSKTAIRLLNGRPFFWPFGGWELMGGLLTAALLLLFFWAIP